MKKTFIFIWFSLLFVVSLQAQTIHIDAPISDTVTQTKDIINLDWADGFDLYRYAKRRFLEEELDSLDRVALYLSLQNNMMLGNDVLRLEGIVKRDSEIIDNLMKVNSSIRWKSNQDDLRIKQLELEVREQKVRKKEAWITAACFAVLSGLVMISK